MLDRYQAFSAEILRIALLGLSGLGFFVSSFLVVAKKTAAERTLNVPDEAKYWVIASAVAFGCSAAAALFHRYCSTNSMACQLRILRLEVAQLRSPDSKKERSIKKERKERQLMFVGSTIFIAAAPLALSVAGLAFAKALAVLLYGSQYH
jgi:hypothetical protein